MDTRRLREATAEDHARVEGSLPLMAEHLTPARYVGVLCGLYGFVRGWEQWAAEHAPAELRGLVEARRRAPLLEGDLRHFGQHTPEGGRWWPEHEARTLPGLLGTMYVLEGSTLGGQLIARHVEQELGLEPGVGDAYFRGYGEDTGSMWREFKQVLEALPASAEEAVVEAARATFRAFEGWMGEHLHACGPAAAASAGARA